jgi:hypothetical protein
MCKIKGYHPISLVWVLLCVPELAFRDYIPLLYKFLRMAFRDETYSGFNDCYEKCIFGGYIESRNMHVVRNMKTKDDIKNFKNPGLIMT